jgi:hypothetical protein
MPMKVTLDMSMHLSRPCLGCSSKSLIADQEKKLNRIPALLLSLAALLGAVPGSSWASLGRGETLDLTNHAVGIAALVILVVAYGFVMAEEFTHLRKSKPVRLAAGLIWAMIAVVYANHGIPHAAAEAVRHNILEYAELFLFLLVAMTYINSMDERLVRDRRSACSFLRMTDRSMAIGSATEPCSWRPLTRTAGLT